MPTDNRVESRRGRARPTESKISGDFLQAVRERWEIDTRKNERKKIHRVLDGDRCCRVFVRPAMTFAHSFQKDRLVAAVMDESWIRDRHKDAKEFVPYALLPVLVVCPKAVLNGTV